MHILNFYCAKQTEKITGTIQLLECIIKLQKKYKSKQRKLKNTVGAKQDTY